MAGYFRLVFPDTVSRNEIYDSLIKLDTLSHIMKNGGVKACTTMVPNDPLYQPWQWNLLPDTIHGINANGAWENTTGDSNIVIGIIDPDGIRGDHTDLYPRVIGNSYYDGSHGTTVAGIAAANSNNDNLMADVCWKGNIYSGYIGTGGAEETFYATLYAINNGAVALNNSWENIPPDEYRLDDRKIMAYAYKMNRVVVCAKGNDTCGTIDIIRNSLDEKSPP